MAIRIPTGMTHPHFPFVSLPSRHPRSEAAVLRNPSSFIRADRRPAPARPSAGNEVKHGLESISPARRGRAGPGALIGAERQLRQRLTGLRTNALVSTGACLFVLMTQGVPGLAGDASRIAAYVVSGIGFLGGGVIMRDGLNVRGLNTAATLWCTAAIGVLCSMGLLLEATLGSLVVLCANILLRDIAQRLNRQDVLPASEAEQRYEVQIVCRAEDEIQVRSLMLHSLGSSDLRLQSLHSEDLDNPAKLEVRAELLGTPEAPAQLERLVSRVSLEKGVSSVRWQVFELAAD